MPLQQALGYVFAHPSLLRVALTHRSAGEPHMERLEFLGDAVLGLAIASELFRRFPDADEGMLTRMRSRLVSRESLLHIADAWAIEGWLHVGEGERRRGRIQSRSIMANAVEAVIGAVYEDGGWPAAKSLVVRWWEPLIEGLDVTQLLDAKTRLQEWTQARGMGLPAYEVTDLGPGQHPRFRAVCKVQGRIMGEGVGERKKSAEFAASRQAWEALHAD